MGHTPGKADAFLMLWLRSMQDACMMTSSACMMTHKRPRGRMDPVLNGNRFIRVYTASAVAKWPYCATMSPTVFEYLPIVLVPNFGPGLRVTSTVPGSRILVSCCEVDQLARGPIG